MPKIGFAKQKNEYSDDTGTRARLRYRGPPFFFFCGFPKFRELKQRPLPKVDFGEKNKVATG